MKRLLVILCLVPMSLFVMSSAIADNPNDFTAGSNKVTQESGDYQHPNVSAHSGSAGEDPRGNVQITFQSAFFGGTAHLIGSVDCLNVTGTQAQVAALLRDPFNGNSHVTLIIFDGGNPTAGESSDLVFMGFTSTPPANCANSGGTLLGDSSGNVIVRDAA